MSANAYSPSSVGIGWRGRSILVLALAAAAAVVFLFPVITEAGHTGGRIALAGQTPPTPPAVPQPFFADDIKEKAVHPAEGCTVPPDRDYFKADQTYYD